MRLVHTLSNPTNRALLMALGTGPSYPRELAGRLHITEGQAQKRLRELAGAGLLEAEWHHDGKTVKRYVLRVHGVEFDFESGDIRGRLLPAPATGHVAQDEAPAVGAPARRA